MGDAEFEPDDASGAGGAAAVWLRGTGAETGSWEAICNTSQACDETHCSGNILRQSQEFHPSEVQPPLYSAETAGSPQADSEPPEVRSPTHGAAGAALNAAMLAIQPLEGERVHVAATDPARGWMRSSSA